MSKTNNTKKCLLQASDLQLWSLVGERGWSAFPLLLPAPGPRAPGRSCPLRVGKAARPSLLLLLVVALDGE